MPRLRLSVDCGVEPATLPRMFWAMAKVAPSSLAEAATLRPLLMAFSVVVQSQRIGLIEVLQRDHRAAVGIDVLSMVFLP